jgi:hypothetical protein
MIMSVLVLSSASTIADYSPVSGTSLNISDGTTGVNYLSLSTGTSSTGSMIGGQVSAGPSTGDGTFVYSSSANSATNFGSNQSANASRGTWYRSTTGGITDIESRTSLNSISSATNTGTSQEATLSDTSVGTSRASTSSYVYPGSSTSRLASSSADLLGGSSYGSISTSSSASGGSYASVSSSNSDSAGNGEVSGLYTGTGNGTGGNGYFGLNLSKYTSSSWTSGSVGSSTSDYVTGLATTTMGQSGGTTSGSFTTTYSNNLSIDASAVLLTKRNYNSDGSSNAYGVAVDSANIVHLGTTSYDTSDNLLGYGTGFSLDTIANSTQTTGKLVLDSTQGMNANNGGITNAGAISGVTTLSVSGDIISGGSVAALTVNSTGNTNVGGNLTVTGNTTQNGNQTVNGTSTFNNDLNVTNGVASFQNGASVSGGNLNMNNNKITNVAAGVVGTDAVNVNQLNATNQSLNNVSQVAYSGIASVSAIAGIPGLQGDKRFNLGLGYGNYHGQNAMAVGSNVKIMENLTAKASIGVLSADVTTSVGVGLQF